MSDRPVPLERLLEASAATAEFKEAVRALEAGKSQERICFNDRTPPVKALRVVSKLLEARSDWKIESVSIDGQSGCSDFAGSLVVEPGDHRIDFVWDCKTRAEHEGWTDPLGYPDQSRAAREFGYQCFQKFEDIG